MMPQRQKNRAPVYLYSLGCAALSRCPNNVHQFKIALLSIKTAAPLRSHQHGQGKQTQGSHSFSEGRGSSVFASCCLRGTQHASREPLV